MTKSILYSVCIGSLALVLTAGGAQAANDKRPERTKPQQRTARVQAARPANTGRTMSVHRNVSAAQHQQRSGPGSRAPVLHSIAQPGRRRRHQLQFANETSRGTKGCVSATRKSLARGVTLR